jgi:hypothetical protein
MNLETLPQLAKDKANHHIYGEFAALIGAIAGPPLAAVVGVQLDRRIGALTGAVVAGAIKEAWDKLTGKGDPSVGDFVATASGALPVMAGLSLTEP